MGFPVPRPRSSYLALGEAALWPDENISTAQWASLPDLTSSRLLEVEASMELSRSLLLLPVLLVAGTELCLVFRRELDLVWEESCLCLDSEPSLQLLLCGSVSQVVCFGFVWIECVAMSNLDLDSVSYLES